MRKTLDLWQRTWNIFHHLSIKVFTQYMWNTLHLISLHTFTLHKFTFTLHKFTVEKDAICFIKLKTNSELIFSSDSPSSNQNHIFFFCKFKTFLVKIEFCRQIQVLFRREPGNRSQQTIINYRCYLPLTHTHTLCAAWKWEYKWHQIRVHTQSFLLLINGSIHYRWEAVRWMSSRFVLTSILLKWEPASLLNRLHLSAAD